MPVKRKTKIDALPEEFPTLEAAGEFWDEHDATDYLEYTRPVRDFSIRIIRRRYLVALDPSVAKKVSEVARTRGLTSAALVNRWLRDRLKRSGRKR